MHFPGGDTENCAGLRERKREREADRLRHDNKVGNIFYFLLVFVPTSFSDSEYAHFSVAFA